MRRSVEHHGTADDIRPAVKGGAPQPIAQHHDVIGIVAVGERPPTSGWDCQRLEEAR